MSEAPRPNLDPDKVPNWTFDVVRKGYDTAAVKAFLLTVADELRVHRRREGDLERRLQEMADNPAPIEVNEETLVGALGVETARILQAAHEAARDIVARAERRAAALIAHAEGAFAERTRLADSEAAEMRANVRDEVLAIENDAREKSREMVDEAREARRRILSDLVERRRSLHLQLEQIRAGKDALTEIVESVSQTVVSSVDELKALLEGSEESARLAAAAAEIDPLVESELAIVSLEVEELGAVIRPPSVLFAESDPFENAGLAEGAETSESGESGAEPAAVGEGAGGGGHEGESTGEGDPAPGEAGTDGGSSAGNDAPGAPVISADETKPSEIDELFKRIRVDRGGAEASASVVDEPPTDVPESPVPESTPAESSTAEVANPEPAIAESADSESTSPPPAPQSPAPESPSEPAEEADGKDDLDLRVRRDLLVGPAVAELGRSLKRALRVEENELRDRARHLPRDPEGLGELVRPSTVAKIADASERPLAQAMQAGGAFIAELLEVDPVDLPGHEPRTIAQQLANEIVDPLRQRVESALRESDDEPDPSTAVGVAFRDWRGAKVEAIAIDFVTRAFSAGAVAMARRHGANLTWVVDDGTTNCPDCEDNALAGEVEPGSPFPTGQAHPPIHPGCRCLLVPVSKS